MTPRTNHLYKGSEAPEKKIIHPNTNCRPSKSIHHEQVWVINPVDGSEPGAIPIQNVRKRRGWTDPT